MWVSQGFVSKHLKYFITLKAHQISNWVNNVGTGIKIATWPSTKYKFQTCWTKLELLLNHNFWSLDVLLESAVNIQIVTTAGGPSMEVAHIMITWLTVPGLMSVFLCWTGGAEQEWTSSLIDHGSSCSRLNQHVTINLISHAFSHSRPVFVVLEGTLPCWDTYSTRDCHCH